MLRVTDKSTQDFLTKATKIVSIFMKDKKTPHELARSVLKFLKLAVTVLEEDRLKGEQGICKNIIDQLFSSKENHHVKKHKLMVRRILTKLIRRMGGAAVTRLMPEIHRPMVAYIEREKRKIVNRRERQKLLFLMGQGDKAKTQASLKEDGEDSSEDDSSDDEGNQLKMSKKERATEEDNQSSEDESDQDMEEGVAT
jgi:hypothetical protein